MTSREYTPFRERLLHKKYSLMALESFVVACSLLQFLNPIQSSEDSLDGDQLVARSLHSQANTNIINVHTGIHASSWIRNQECGIRTGEGSSSPRPHVQCDGLYMKYT
jgi:hypothetical protein